MTTTRTIIAALAATAALSGTALAFTPEEEARVVALETKVTTQAATIDALTVANDGLIDYLSLQVPYLTQVARGAADGARLQRCMKVLYRVTISRGFFRAATSWRGSFWVPIFHPACARPIVASHQANELTPLFGTLSRLKKVGG